MLYSSCAQHQQPCLFKGVHRMFWKPSGACCLAHFSKMPYCRLRTGMAVKIWLFPLCVISLYDCTWHYIVTFYFYLFVNAGMCCIICDCSDSSFHLWNRVRKELLGNTLRVFISLLSQCIFGKLRQHKPTILGSISVFYWDRNYFTLGGHWINGFSS